MNSFEPRFISDKEFDDNFPKEIERLSSKHWAPATIAKRAAKFLVNRPGIKVLDIGSGAGKFCVIAAACNDGMFVGVEQRKNLCLLAEKLGKKYHLQNVEFIHANVMDIDFNNYDAFFFYNAFYENIEDNNAIDNSIELNPEIYISYTEALTKKLGHLPQGTRLVTYWGEWVPEGYELVYANGNDSLRFWEKI